MSQRTVLYKGYKLPSEVVDKIRKAIIKWRASDSKRWEFAQDAAEIVGLYIPEATAALARAMGVDSPSTPEGYCKAWQLAELLLGINHIAPLSNLYISHYITVGKAYGAKANEENYYDILVWADKLLRDANKWEWTIEQLRSKLKGQTGDDSWSNSVTRIIPQLEAHIINAPYLGVDEFRAAVAAKVGRVFIQVLRWAINSKEPLESQQKTETQNEIDHLITSSQILFPDPQA